MKLIPIPALALRIVCSFILFFALTVTATAQIESMASKAPWMQGLFLKMSPNTPEFSAIGQFDLYDPSGKLKLELPMVIAASTNGFRWEADISKFLPLPPEAKALAKMMRTDKTIFLIKTEQREVYMLYPDLKAYVPAQIPASALAYFDARSNRAQLQKIYLGKQVIDGHACIKNKITDVASTSETCVAWNASDLQGFPVKMLLETGRGIMKLQFQNVVIQNPDPSLFEIPRNYMMFTNSAALINYAKSQISR
jgi:hypothetical protein